MTYEERLADILDMIEGLDPDTEQGAWNRLDLLTKPPRSLGRLEAVAARMAAIQGTDTPLIASPAIVLAAGDHGVVAEGVSPYPQDVTWQMVANFVQGGAAVNQLAGAAGADLLLVDAGVRDDTSCLEGVRQLRVGPGTANMAHGPAMSREDAARAVLAGVDIVHELCDTGCTLVGIGEMGIGNTTSAAALTSVLCGVYPAAVVGRGTGLDDEGVRRKAEVVVRAMEVNDLDPRDPLGVLAALGGYEIAVLTGVAVAAAQRGIALITDGFIATAAVLVAVRMRPEVGERVIASHCSAEPGHRVQLDDLGLDPILDLDLRLGEGTGAALAMPIVDAACRMLSGMATFAEAGVSDREADA